MSKGSGRRPTDYSRFSNGWDKAFKTGLQKSLQDKAMALTSQVPANEAALVPVSTPSRTEDTG